MALHSLKALLLFGEIQCIKSKKTQFLVFPGIWYNRVHPVVLRRLFAAQPTF